VGPLISQGGRKIFEVSARDYYGRAMPCDTSLWIKISRFVQSISSLSPNGDYVAGENLLITLEISETVTVSGTPALAMNTAILLSMCRGAVLTS
jgi:hypothetical protein